MEIQCELAFKNNKNIWLMGYGTINHMLQAGYKRLK